MDMMTSEVSRRSMLGLFSLAAALPLVGCASVPRAAESAPAWRTKSEIGRAHVCTPVTNAHLVCRLLLDKKKSIIITYVPFYHHHTILTDHDTLILYIISST